MCNMKEREKKKTLALLLPPAIPNVVGNTYTVIEFMFNNPFKNNVILSKQTNASWI